MVKPEETLPNEDEFINVTCGNIEIDDPGPTMSPEFSTAETTSASIEISTVETTATSTVGNTAASTAETTVAFTEENMAPFKVETTDSPAKKGLCLYVFPKQ